MFALGHSTRPIAELTALLRAHGIVTLADIRTIPRSRANPQFDQAALAESLAKHGLGYAHLPRLGGLRARGRRAGSSSPASAAWKNASFRAYADHMQTDEFARGLEELRELALRGPVAILCAEAVPWRCHRSLVADALFARGVVVTHLIGLGKGEPHRPRPFARFDGTRVTYPAEGDGVADERDPLR